MFSLKKLSLCALALSQAAFAGSYLGTGDTRANTLADNITAVEGAVNEAKIEKDKPELEKEKPQTEAAPPESQAKKKKPAINLPSRLEVVGGSDTMIAISGVLSQVSLFGEARYRLSQNWQFGATAGIRMQGSDSQKDIAAQLLFGPIFNFGDTLNGFRDSWFTTVKGGVTAERQLVDGHLTQHSNSPTLSVGIGKRFAISNKVSYSPSFSVVKQEYQAPCYVAVPIALSVFF